MFSINFYSNFLYICQAIDEMFLSRQSEMECVTPIFIILELTFDDPWVPSAKTIFCVLDTKKLCNVHEVTVKI